ncbi:MAG TPA: VOC family protein [Actinomycetota bacterium]|jgi:predicted 3-demethylubiquinone-9 3-methyltransferase (glyoxalase superfamily)|nr:VOC family protein [Actinomycetota bacterium]
MTQIEQKITPFLWFDDRAEEAANFYVSLFEDSEVVDVARYPEGVPGRTAGDAMTVSFRLAGQGLIALNGGPEFSFTEAISLYVRCADQDEVDRLWDQLIDGGGEPSQCGWLKDRFGLSWQIVPDRLTELLGDADPARANAAMQAMLQMQKIEVKTLEDAANAA